MDPPRPHRTSTDDDGLIEAARRGDRQALEQLLRRHYDRVYAVCRRITGNDADAVHDLLLAQRQYYETWGRELDIQFYTSSGEDESAQRADAVAIKALKPFAVVTISPTPATSATTTAAPTERASSAALPLAKTRS